MKVIHYMPCKVICYNQYTKKEKDLTGEIRKEKWLKFQQLVEKKYIRKLY